MSKDGRDRATTSSMPSNQIRETRPSNCPDRCVKRAVSGRKPMVRPSVERFGGSGIAMPVSGTTARPPDTTAGKKFIAGEPMKRPTCSVNGWSNSTCGAAACTTLPWFITTTSSAKLMASVWSCVTSTMVTRNSALIPLLPAPAGQKPDWARYRRISASRYRFRPPAHPSRVRPDRRPDRNGCRGRG